LAFLIGKGGALVTYTSAEDKAKQAAAMAVIARTNPDLAARIYSGQQAAIVAASPELASRPAVIMPTQEYVKEISTLAKGTLDRPAVTTLSTQTAKTSPIESAGYNAGDAPTSEKEFAVSSGAAGAEMVGDCTYKDESGNVKPGICPKKAALIIGGIVAFAAIIYYLGTRGKR
jgi:hypothetical protein